MYSKDGVQIKSDGLIMHRFWLNENTGTIDFYLRSNIYSYYSYLISNEVDTISFDLTEIKDPSCCGYISISINTYLY